MAMGDASAADLADDWHSNPAAVTAIQARTVYASFGSSSFDLLPTFRVAGVGYAQPFAAGAGAIKVTAFFVRARGAAAALGGLDVDAREDDVGVEAGWRLGRHFRIGAGTAYLTTSSTYTASGVGTVTRLSSRPDGFGGRVGALFTPVSWLAAGISMDLYKERVASTAPLGGRPPSNTTFTSTAVRLGLSIQPTEATQILVDRESLDVEGDGSVAFERNVWKIGGQHRMGRIALRGGLFDGRPTAGVSVRLQGAEIAYVATGRYKSDLPEFGARIGHLLQVMHQF
jgi:hypothetical protein